MTTYIPKRTWDRFISKKIQIYIFLTGTANVQLFVQYTFFNKHLWAPLYPGYCPPMQFSIECTGGGTAMWHVRVSDVTPFPRLAGQWGVVMRVYIYLFIYFWLRWVFVAARRLSLVAASGGYSSLRCAGFSLWWLLLLRSPGSRRVGFSSCGSRALERRLSSCGARA